MSEEHFTASETLDVLVTSWRSVIHEGQIHIIYHVELTWVHYSSDVTLSHSGRDSGGRITGGTIHPFTLTFTLACRSCCKHSHLGMWSGVRTHRRLTSVTGHTRGQTWSVVSHLKSRSLSIAMVTEGTGRQESKRKCSRDQMDGGRWLTAD